MNTLKLSHNQLTGLIPEDICNIERVYFEDNILTGPVPDCVCNMVYISLSNNNLCGDSPNCIDIGSQSCSP